MLRLLPLLLLLLTACASDPVETVAPLDPLFVDIEAVTDEHWEDTNAPGVAIGVVMSDGRSWYSARGFRKEETGETVQPTDRFRVGSITKTFVAAAIMQLVGEGELSLDDAIVDWLPQFALDEQITIEQLLSHTSGIYNFSDDETFVGEGATSPTEVILFALDHEMLFAPGQDYTYSNTGYFLLGMLLEKIEGKAAHQVIRDRFLDPLKLNNTAMEQFEKPELLPIQGHLLGQPSDEIFPDFDMGWAWTAGAMVSNTRDLCRWAETLLYPARETAAVLTPAARAQMQRNVELPDGTAAGYGLGLDVSVRGGRDVIGHTGSTMGFKGELFVDQETHACVTVQANDFLSEPTRLSHKIWERIGQDL